MDQPEKLPRLSYDLITQMDEAWPAPRVDHTLKGLSEFDDAAVRRLAFKAGQRSVVEALMAERDAEEAHATDTAEDETTIEPAGPDYRPWAGSTRVAQSDGSLREVSIGGWLDDQPSE